MPVENALPVLGLTGRLETGSMGYGGGRRISRGGQDDGLAYVGVSAKEVDGKQDGSRGEAVTAAQRIQPVGEVGLSSGQEALIQLHIDGSHECITGNGPDPEAEGWAAGRPLLDAPRDVTVHRGGIAGAIVEPAGQLIVLPRQLRYGVIVGEGPQGDRPIGRPPLVCAHR